MSAQLAACLNEKFSFIFSKLLSFFNLFVFAKEQGKHLVLEILKLRLAFESFCVQLMKIQILEVGD